MEPTPICNSPVGFLLWLNPTSTSHCHPSLLDVLHIVNLNICICISILVSPCKPASHQASQAGCSELPRFSQRRCRLFCILSLRSLPHKFSGITFTTHNQKTNTNSFGRCEPAWFARRHRSSILLGPMRSFGRRIRSNRRSSKESWPGM